MFGDWMAVQFRLLTTEIGRRRSQHFCNTQQVSCTSPTSRKSTLGVADAWRTDDALELSALTLIPLIIHQKRASPERMTLFRVSWSRSGGRRGVGNLKRRGGWAVCP